jgi:hypothetical protein
MTEGAHGGLGEDDEVGPGLCGPLHPVGDEVEVRGRVGRGSDLGEGDPHETSS